MLCINWQELLDHYIFKKVMIISPSFSSKISSWLFPSCSSFTWLADMQHSLKCTLIEDSASEAMIVLLRCDILIRESWIDWTFLGLLWSILSKSNSIWGSEAQYPNELTNVKLSRLLNAWLKSSAPTCSKLIPSTTGAKVYKSNIVQRWICGNIYPISELDLYPCLECWAGRRAGRGRCREGWPAPRWPGCGGGRGRSAWRPPPPSSPPPPPTRPCTPAPAAAAARRHPQPSHGAQPGVVTRCQVTWRNIALVCSNVRKLRSRETVSTLVTTSHKTPGSMRLRLIEENVKLVSEDFDLKAFSIFPYSEYRYVSVIPDTVDHTLNLTVIWSELLSAHNKTSQVH